MKTLLRFYFWAMAAHGQGISGSDRIFIELARHWSIDNSVNIILWREGKIMCEKQNLNGKNLSFKILNMEPWSGFGFFINYFARIFKSINYSFKLHIERNTIAYSSSDFWMDLIPCVILKIRYPKLKWVATWYQTSPNPIKGFSEGDRKEKYIFHAFLYWFSQLPIKPLIKKYADYVIVNNEVECRQFSIMDKMGKVIVLLGAVRLDDIENWKLKLGKLSKVYDAVFQGRFHPQKGVVELIDIWKKVVEKRPHAKLAMIGDGPLMKDVRDKIQDLRLEKNVKLFGYLFDGEEKYRIFSQSKIVVHPSFYDSGGMSAAEAMAFGLPCVGFALKAYESYYPNGMIKVEDENGFGKVILELLNNSKERKRIGHEAIKLIEEHYSWDRRAEEVYSQIIM